MSEVFSWKGAYWEYEILIRKSWLILFLIIARVLFFTWILAILVSLVFSIKWYLVNNWYSYVYYLFGIIILILWIYFWIMTVVWFIRYFYDVFVVTKDKICKLNIWLFLRENIDFIELYRIQEMRAQSDNFLQVLLNIGNIVLVEQNDTERMIHWIDKPKKKLIMMGKVKDQLVKNRSK